MKRDPENPPPVLQEFQPGCEFRYGVLYYRPDAPGKKTQDLFEYMAVGKPVISAKWEEIEKLKSPAWLYNDIDDFVVLVQKASEMEHDPKPFISYAKSHDWINAYNTLSEHISLVY